MLCDNLVVNLLALNLLSLRLNDLSLEVHYYMGFKGDLQIGVLVLMSRNPFGLKFRKFSTVFAQPGFAGVVLTLEL